MRNRFVIEAQVTQCQGIIEMAGQVVRGYSERLFDFCKSLPGTAMLHPGESLVGVSECFRSLFLFVAQSLADCCFSISLFLLPGSPQSLTELIINATILSHQRQASAKLPDSTLKIALVTQGQSEIAMPQPRPSSQSDRVDQMRLA